MLNLSKCNLDVKTSSAVHLCVNICMLLVFPQSLKLKGFRKDCWYPKHRQNIDNYIESRWAARNMGSEIIFLLHVFWDKDPSSCRFFGGKNSDFSIGAKEIGHEIIYNRKQGIFIMGWENWEMAGRHNLTENTVTSHKVVTQFIQ